MNEIALFPGIRFSISPTGPSNSCWTSRINGIFPNLPQCSTFTVQKTAKPAATKIDRQNATTPQSASLLVHHHPVFSSTISRKYISSSSSSANTYIKVPTYFLPCPTSPWGDGEGWCGVDWKIANPPPFRPPCTYCRFSRLNSEWVSETPTGRHTT